MNTSQAIKNFFDAYQERFNNALRGNDDVDATVSAFAECFVGASPLGTFCGSNNAEFRDAISKGNQFYRDIGTLSMNIIRVEITQLNSVHFMAKVFWTSTYKKDPVYKSIDFEVVYLLQQRDNSFKIFAYVTEDEQKVLQEQGILTKPTQQEIEQMAEIEKVQD